jgi:hypothetical protein
MSAPGAWLTDGRSMPATVSPSTLIETPAFSSCDWLASGTLLPPVNIWRAAAHSADWPQSSFAAAVLTAKAAAHARSAPQIVCRRIPN